MANHRFTLRSGRGVGVSASGDPMARRLVVFCHPTPGAGGFDPDPLVTEHSKVYLLMLDRPGYGGSEPLRPGEAADFEQRADDLAQFLRESETTARSVSGADFGAVGVVGWMSGGWVALALAARHPELVDRVAIVDTPAPRGNVVRRGGGDALHIARSVRNGSIAEVAADLARHQLETLEVLGISQHDPGLSLLGARNRVERMLADAQTQGEVGVATDLVSAQNASWAAGAHRITASVKVLYGDSRDVEAASDAEWFRRHIPGADVVRARGADRLAVVSHWKRVLQHVAPQHDEA